MATNYQDWWWNPDQNGMGVNIGHQQDTVAAAWYLYENDGSSAFLILSGKVVGNEVNGNLYRSSGPLPGPNYNPNQVDTTAVGTASITFTSETTATLTYDYDGLSGSWMLERFSYGSYSLNGEYAMTSTFTRTGCQNSVYNFETFDAVLASVTSDGLSLEINQVAPSCTGSIDLTQSGSTFQGSGEFSCTSGQGGTIEFSELRLGGDHFFGRYTEIFTEGETCREVGIVSGLEIP